MSEQGLDGDPEWKIRYTGEALPGFADVPDQAAMDRLLQQSAELYEIARRLVEIQGRAFSARTEDRMCELVERARKALAPVEGGGE